MNCKLGKLEIPADQPFLNCKLGREKYAEVLKAIITTYEKGFVLAIDGKWGTGKTTFVEMWKAYLELDNFQTLYFNAWENDSISDPLVGLLGELTKINSSKRTKDLASSMINTAGRIVLKAVPAMFKGVIKKYAGEEVVEILRDCAEEGSSMLEKEIDNYESQKGSLLEFRKELEKFVDEVCEKKPLIFIIDELDRCNPHYAVKVLERIKHLFNIPNIIFVLSIDKEQLSHSIRGYYGSDLINANEYLKRFIDIEYALPDPDVDRFCQYLFEYYNFQPFFFQAQDLPYNNESSTILSFLSTASTIFKYKRLTLRQAEKVFINTRLSLNMFGDTHDKIHVDLLCLLTYLRVCESDFYEKISRREYNTIQELINQIELIFPQQIFDANPIDSWPYITFHETIALLLRHYAMEPAKNDKELMITDINGDEKLCFKTKFIDESSLIEAIQRVNQLEVYTYLETIIAKINLLDNLQVQ
ncbi:KAP family P-loop NTPase fold protein [Bacteroides thetaiotaomicron]|jgi:hypothetical protein|uniref:KAP family P-loop NTPase fold protein n=1 Tax=Bacteroides thetaiotaomicron TaxID=818 RepID=UPI001F240FA6|nr:P-loop NTPase fold protein [Bacteroides thetaiotaomicron]MCE9077143.1 KAP family NTPase [Bacteroides thetaiotaomicron]MCS2602446.1 KAP family NTPase [Bacteroides thetaiotaomicron]